MSYTQGEFAKPFGNKTSQFDFWATPIDLCINVVDQILKDFPETTSFNTFIDPGCGCGNWGLAIRNAFHDNIYLTGVDIRYDLGDAKQVYDKLYNADYLKIPYYKLGTADMIVGNPPFRLAEEFIYRSLELLNPGGYLIFLERLAFLEGRRRQRNLYEKFNPIKVYVLTRRVPFFYTMGILNIKSVGTTPFSIFVWKKGYEGPTQLDWLYWE